LLASNVVSEAVRPAIEGRERTAPPPAAPALGRDRLVFGIVSIALLMASVDQTIVATALTALHRDLHAGINWSSWTITIYALGQVVAMPLAGKLSDQYGRRTTFLVAAVLFTGASLACGLANSIYLLVAFRAVQACGGGAFMPSATGIISDQFGPRRDRAIGMFTSILPIGGIIGPVLGGVIVSTWSWREIFLVNVPLGLVLITLAARFLPRGGRRPSGRTDVRGVLLLALAILAAMFGITTLGNAGGGVLTPAFLLPEAVAVVAGVLFVRHARRAAAPFIPLTLLRGRGFGVMNGINLLYGAAALGVGTLVPLYAQQRYHIATLEAGVLLTARAVGMICVASLAVLALRRTGYRLPMVVGFVIVAAGLVLMAVRPPAGVTPYLWLSVAAGITGVGMGLSVPATNNATLALAPDQVAAIAGLRGMFRQSGAIIGVSVSTAILARSARPGLATVDILLVLAALLVAVLPLVRLVPEHRGSW
jgi:EmrB/QacA subfamily drug resistance transporter